MHRDAHTGQITTGPQPKPSGEPTPNHTVLHVDTTTSEGMASAFRRAPLKEGRAARLPTSA